MKIGILFNCQHESLALALRALLPEADIIHFDLSATHHNPAACAAIAASLATCDHVVTQDVASVYGGLSTTALRASVRRLHLLPSFRFAGFHPDTVSLSLDGVNLGGPTGGYHSRIATAGFLAGLSPRATADLFNRLSYARLGYFHAFAEQRSLLLDRYATYRIDLRAEFDTWLTAGCFMHTVDHPRMRVMLDLARIICVMAGTPPTRTPAEADLRDPLADLPIHPVFPDIAAAIDIPPAGAFRGAAVNGRRPRALSTEAFCAASHEIMARTPRATLRAVDGIAAAMTALGLTERVPPAPPPSTDALSTAFLTFHGTVLGLETASGMLVQHRMLDHDVDSVDLTVNLPSLPLQAPVSATALGGFTMAPGDTPNTVTLRRNGKYLCAEAGMLGVRFTRDEAAGWETFLPVRATHLAALRRIASSAWRIPRANGGALQVPAASIYLETGFTLALADLRVDLRENPPEPTADGTGFTLDTTTGPVTLVPPEKPATRIEQRLFHTPAHLTAGEIGSPEEFRLTREARLTVQAGAEYLHPPLDASDADRAWLHDKYFDNRIPYGIGRKYFASTIVRGRDRLLMLGRTVEGALLGPHGMDKDMGFIVHSVGLPPYLRTVGGTHLLNLAATENVPVINGPVCVFYNGNLQNYYHWIVESMLALHVLAPYLPPGTRLVLPGTLAAMRQNKLVGFDQIAILDALGFGKFARIELNHPVARLTDAIWLDNDSIHTMPAAQVQSFRARAAALQPPQAGPRRRLYIKRTHLRRIANAELLEAFLEQQDFETVVLENMPPAAQISMFAQAEFVIAPHGAALANLLFCPAGTRVLELTPDFEFRPFFWLIAQKLNLPYGALPCPTHDKTFNGDLTVDMGRLRALYKMLRNVIDD
jgi:hypothetical protein